VSDDACTTCGREPGEQLPPSETPAALRFDGGVVYSSRIRIVGRNGHGDITRLCTRCYCDQNPPKQPVENQLPLNKKRTKQR